MALRMVVLLIQNGRDAPDAATLASHIATGRQDLLILHQNPVEGVVTPQPVRRAVQPPPAATNSVPYTGSSVYFTRSPFYNLVQTVLGSPQICRPTLLNARVPFYVTFNAEELKLFQRCQQNKNYRVFVFSGAIPRGGANSMEVPVEFPMPLRLSVNGNDVNVLLFKGIKGKPGTAKPADITDYIVDTPRRNNLEVQYCNTTDAYLIYMCFVEVVSAETLLERILAKPKIAKYTTIQRIRDSSGDDDIEMGTLLVPLRDPVMFTRLKYPIQLIYCDHPGCFDGLMFLQQQIQLPQWQCPYCGRKVSMDDLAVSEYFEEILRTCPEDVTTVTIKSDGSWVADDIEMDDSDDDDDYGGAKPPALSATPAPKLKADEIEVVCLDSDEDEDNNDAAPAAANTTAVADHLTQNDPPLSPRRQAPRILSSSPEPEGSAIETPIGRVPRVAGVSPTPSRTPSPARARTTAATTLNSTMPPGARPPNPTPNPSTTAPRPTTRRPPTNIFISLRRPRPLVPRPAPSNPQPLAANGGVRELTGTTQTQQSALQSSAADEDDDVPLARRVPGNSTASTSAAQPLTLKTATTTNKAAKSTAATAASPVNQPAPQPAQTTNQTTTALTAGPQTAVHEGQLPLVQPVSMVLPPAVTLPSTASLQLVDSQAQAQAQARAVAIAQARYQAQKQQASLFAALEYQQPPATSPQPTQPQQQQQQQPAAATPSHYQQMRQQAQQARPQAQAQPARSQTSPTLYQSQGYVQQPQQQPQQAQLPQYEATALYTVNPVLQAHPPVQYVQYAQSLESAVATQPSTPTVANTGPLRNLLITRENYQKEVQLRMATERLYRELLLKLKHLFDAYMNARSKFLRETFVEPIVQALNRVRAQQIAYHYNQMQELDHLFQTKRAEVALALNKACNHLDGLERLRRINEESTFQNQRMQRLQQIERSYFFEPVQRNYTDSYLRNVAENLDQLLAYLRTQIAGQKKATKSVSNGQRQQLPQGALPGVAQIDMQIQSQIQSQVQSPQVQSPSVPVQSPPVGVSAQSSPAVLAPSPQVSVSQSPVVQALPVQPLPVQALPVQALPVQPQAAEPVRDQVDEGFSYRPLESSLQTSNTVTVTEPTVTNPTQVLETTTEKPAESPATTTTTTGPAVTTNAATTTTTTATIAPALTQPQQPLVALLEGATLPAQPLEPVTQPPREESPPVAQPQALSLNNEGGAQPSAQPTQSTPSAPTAPKATTVATEGLPTLPLKLNTGATTTTTTTTTRVELPLRSSVLPEIPRLSQPPPSGPLKSTIPTGPLKSTIPAGPRKVTPPTGPRSSTKFNNRPTTSSTRLPGLTSTVPTKPAAQSSSSSSTTPRPQLNIPTQPRAQTTTQTTAHAATQANNRLATAPVAPQAAAASTQSLGLVLPGKRKLSPSPTSESPKRIKGMLGITIALTVLDGDDTMVDGDTTPTSPNSPEPPRPSQIPADAMVIDLTDD